MGTFIGNSRNTVSAPYSSAPTKSSTTKSNPVKSITTIPSVKPTPSGGGTTSYGGTGYNPATHSNVQTTVTQTNLPAKKQAPVISVDTTTSKTQDRTGGFSYQITPSGTAVPYGGITQAQYNAGYTPTNLEVQQNLNQQQNQTQVQTSKPSGFSGYAQNVREGFGLVTPTGKNYLGIDQTAGINFLGGAYAIFQPLQALAPKAWGDVPYISGNKASQVASYTYELGSLNQNPLLPSSNPFSYVKNKTTGYQDLIKQKNINLGIETSTASNVITNLNPKYQALADAGKIDRNLLQVQYQTEANANYQSALKLNPKYINTSGAEAFLGSPVVNIPRGIVTGGLIGTSLGGGLLAVAGNQAIAFSGVYDTSKGIQEGNYWKAGAGVAMAGLGAYGAYSASQSYIVNTRIAEVQGQTAIGTAQRLPTGDYMTETFNVVQRTPRAIASSSGFVNYKLAGENTFDILGGKTNTLVITKTGLSGFPEQNVFAMGTQVLGKSSGVIGSPLASGVFPSQFQIVSATPFSSYGIEKESGVFKTTTTLNSNPSYTTENMFGFAKPLGNSYVVSSSGKIIDVSGFQIGKGTLGITPSSGFGFNVQGQVLSKVLQSTPSKTLYFNPTGSGSFSSTPYTPYGGVSATGQFTTQTTSSISSVLSTPALSTGSKLFSVAPSLFATGISTTQLGNQKSSFTQVPSLITAPSLASSNKKVNIPFNIPYTPQAIAPSLSIGQQVLPIQITPQITEQTSVASSSPSQPFNFPFQAIPIIPFGFGGDLDFGSRSRTLKVKRRSKYTPSYESFVLGLKGKAPKGMETGARTRPIPKGFSFAFKGGDILKGGFNLGTTKRKTTKTKSFISRFKIPKFKMPKLK